MLAKLSRRLRRLAGYLPIETPHIERRMEVLTGKGAGSDEVLRQNLRQVTNKGGPRASSPCGSTSRFPWPGSLPNISTSWACRSSGMRSARSFAVSGPPRDDSANSSSATSTYIGQAWRAPSPTPRRPQVIGAAALGGGSARFSRSRSATARILDGLLDSLGVADKTGPVLRALDKLAKAGRDKVLAELQRGEAAGEGNAGREPLLSADQAQRVLDRARRAAGIDILAWRPRSWRPGRHSGGCGHRQPPHRLRTARRGGRALQTRLQIDLGLLRGLDYYTEGPAFRKRPSTAGSGFSAASARWGRYDNLASLFTDRRLPGVGASDSDWTSCWHTMEEAGCGSMGPRRPPRSWWRTSRASPRRSRCSLPPASAPPRSRRRGVSRADPDPASRWATAWTRGHRLPALDCRARRVSPGQLFNLRNLATPAGGEGNPPGASSRFA